MEAGKKYYVILHAYHHFLCECVDPLGPTRARVKDVVKVHSCRRGWGEFFRDGCKDDTTTMRFPDGTLSGWMAVFDWPHKIPGVTDATRQ